jgi:hypothetical protein
MRPQYYTLYALNKLASPGWEWACISRGDRASLVQSTIRGTGPKSTPLSQLARADEAARVRPMAQCVFSPGLVACGDVQSAHVARQPSSRAMAMWDRPDLDGHRRQPLYLHNRTKGQNHTA